MYDIFINPIINVKHFFLFVSVERTQAIRLGEFDSVDKCGHVRSQAINQTKRTCSICRAILDAMAATQSRDVIDLITDGGAYRNDDEIRIQFPLPSGPRQGCKTGQF